MGDFSLSFNVDEDDYEEFITNLREVLSNRTSHGVGVLLPQSEQLRWLHIRLTAGNRSITLKFEQNNLYLRGYSRDDGNTFFEFSDTHLIPHSTPLAYSGGYVKSDSFRVKSGVTRVTLPLGRMPLYQAIIDLANITNPNSNQDQQLAARSLLVLVQMFAEAARIRLISDHITGYWHEPRAITPRMEKAENAWQNFSHAMQRSDINWVLNTPLPNVPVVNAVDVWTVGQAIAAFGLLLYFETHRQREKRDAAVVSSSDTTVYARTLVNIHYIIVNNIDGENPGQLYGTVVITDCWGEHVIYDRSSDNTENKGPGDYATLTGPSTGVAGEDFFIINVSLKDHDDLSPDDEIAEGTIVWDPREPDSSYDKTLYATVSGKYGSVMVAYSVITEALSATIDVVLINGDGESPAEVYGTIDVYQKLKGSEESSITLPLFNKSSNSYVEVRPKESIPLTRSVVPAPTNLPLKIAATLWDYDLLSSDDEIANGSVEFLPAVGKQTKNIKGENGEVQVSVTFE